MFDWLRRAGTDPAQISKRSLAARVAVLEEQNAGYRLTMADLVSQAEEILERANKARDRVEAANRRADARAGNGPEPASEPWINDPEGWRAHLASGQEG